MSDTKQDNNQSKPSTYIKPPINLKPNDLKVVVKGDIKSPDKK